MSPLTPPCITTAPEAMPTRSTFDRTDKSQAVSLCTGVPPGRQVTRLWKGSHPLCCQGGTSGGCPLMRSLLSALLRGGGVRKPEMLHSMPGNGCPSACSAEGRMGQLHNLFNGCEVLYMCCNLGYCVHRAVIAMHSLCTACFVWVFVRVFARGCIYAVTLKTVMLHNIAHALATANLKLTFFLCLQSC